MKLMARWRQTRSLEPAKQERPSGSGKLEAQRAFLIGRVKERPDITMPELAAELELRSRITVNPASLSRFLCAAGFTYKKLVPAKAGKRCWLRSRHAPTLCKHDGCGWIVASPGCGLSRIGLYSLMKHPPIRE